MKKKIGTLGVIVVIAVVLFFQNTFGTFYGAPETALHHWDSDFQSIIDTVRVQDERVIFYVTKYGDFCEAEFINKEVFGKTVWKTVSSGKLPPIKNIDPLILIPTEMGGGLYTNKNEPNNNLLFGVTKSAKADTIRVNGKTPTFKAFEVGGLMYTLWYIVGSNELDFDKVKITSD